MNDALTTIAVGLLMLGGLAGIVIPFVPGLPTIWAGALVYALVVDEGSSACMAMAIITGLLVIGAAAKVVVPGRRMAGEGTPRSTMVAGAIGGIIGFFVIPVVGLPIGAVVAILYMEHRRTNDLSRAWVSTKAAIVGFGIGTLIEIAAGLAMVATWVVWALFAS